MNIMRFWKNAGSHIKRCFEKWVNQTWKAINIQSFFKQLIFMKTTVKVLDQIFGLLALVIVVQLSIPMVGHTQSTRLPSKKALSVDGIRIEAKAFKRSYLLYHEVGAKVTAKTQKKKRRWWCAGLCKTRKRVKIDEIKISNTYYAFEKGPFRYDPGLKIVFENERECRKKSKCKLRHYSVGFGSGSFSMDGVKSKISMYVKGKRIGVELRKGDTY